jgi:hypothetical protein
MGNKPVLRPTGDDTFIITYAPSTEKEDFDFAGSLALSRRQEAQKDFEAACNTRLHSFQRLVELIPDEGQTILEWEDDNSQAALLTGYCSGIDHFLAGDWEMAAAIFEMLLDLDPEDHLEATVPLAYTYLAMQEFDSFDEIINDVNDKHIDKVILTLWNGFLRHGLLAEGELIRLKTRFTPYHAEFIAATHPVDEKYLADIKSETPSREALAKELWLQTEHLWTFFPKFIESLRKA